MNDPAKSNALLFWPDGRAKTLGERGLGIDQPPLVTEKEAVTEKAVTENPIVTEIRKILRGRPKKEDALSPAERQARRRARLKEGGE